MDPTYKGLGAPVPTTMPRRGFDLRRGIMLGVGVIGLIVVIGFVVNLFIGTDTKPQRLLLRLEALDTLMSSAVPNIKSDGLSKLNADISLVLAGDTTAIKKIIPTAQASKELAAIKTAEADTDTAAKLKTAVTNGQFDSTYKTVLLDKLNNVSTLAAEVAKGSSKSLKAALATLQEHLVTYYEQVKSLP